MTVIIKKWLMSTLMLALPFQTACEGKFEVDVVGGPGSSAEELGASAEEPDSTSELGDDEQLTSEYVPGSKLIIQGAEAHPVSTVDPSLICSDIEFYNANGSLVWGTANCSTHMEDPNLTPENIKAGTTIFGVTGNFIESPGPCGSNGSQSCVATGSYFAAQACTVNGSQCYLPNYVSSSQPLKAIDYDAIDADKMLASLSIDGKTGSIAERGSWDLTTTYPGDGYYTGTTNTPAAANILSGHTILGVAGSATAAPADCSVDGATACVAVADFPAVDKSLITAGNIKGGVEIIGVTGAYPSLAHPLASATATPDLSSLGSSHASGKLRVF